MTSLLGETGDKITFPATIDELYEASFVNVINGNKIEGVLVTVNGSSEDVREFYPSVFRRVRRPAEPIEDGSDQGKFLDAKETVRAGGNAIIRDNTTPADFIPYKEMVDVDSFMRQLVGKTLEIEVVPVTTLAFQRKDLVVDKVYNFSVVS